MSEWIRVGSGELWHRVSPLEYEEVPVNRPDFVLMCHERIPAAGGWQEWVEELVPQDDQHVACLVRAKREAYWRDRFNAAPKQPMPWMVRDLALEIRPGQSRQLAFLRRLAPDFINRQLWKSSKKLVPVGLG